MFCSVNLGKTKLRKQTNVHLLWGQATLIVSKKKVPQKLILLNSPDDYFDEDFQIFNNIETLNIPERITVQFKAIFISYFVSYFVDWLKKHKRSLFQTHLKKYSKFTLCVQIGVNLVYFGGRFRIGLVWVFSITSEYKMCLLVSNRHTSLSFYTRDRVSYTVPRKAL